MDAVPPPVLTESGTPPPATVPGSSAPPPPKSVLRSRTALMGLLTGLAGLAGTLWPDAGKFLADHADVILLAAGILQVVLRVATHGRVVLFGADES